MKHFLQEPFAGVNTLLHFVRWERCGKEVMRREGQEGIINGMVLI